MLDPPDPVPHLGIGRQVQPRLAGQMVDVTITEAKAYTLRGEVLVRAMA